MRLRRDAHRIISSVGGRLPSADKRHRVWAERCLRLRGPAISQLWCRGPYLGM